mgnify:CR=1 FL=1
MDETENAAETKPKRKRGRPQRVWGNGAAAEVAKAVQQTGITLEQLLAFARELKAPDPEEAAKKAAEKAHAAESRRQMVQMAKDYEAQIAQRQMDCRHVKENGRSAVVGQVHSDGLVHPLCQRCQKAFTPRKPTHEEMPTGLQTV